jgi:hypothetical protein
MRDYDPVFLAEAAMRKLRDDATSGAELASILAGAYATPPAIVRRTMQAMGRRS